MTRSKWFVILFGLCSLAAGFGLRSAVGQPSPPAENKGLDAKVESTIDLGPDFPGYQLRLRTITFEPAGVAGIHSHKERSEERRVGKECRRRTGQQSATTMKKHNTRAAE